MSSLSEVGPDASAALYKRSLLSIKGWNLIVSVSSMDTSQLVSKLSDSSSSRIASQFVEIWAVAVAVEFGLNLLVKSLSSELN